MSGDVGEEGYEEDWSVSCLVLVMHGDGKDTLAELGRGVEERSWKKKKLHLLKIAFLVLTCTFSLLMDA